MKIDEVILVTTANPVYLNCWAPVSEVWRTRFGVRPILFFVGTEEEYETATASGALPATYGPVYHLQYDAPFENPQRPWQAPAALYWGACYAPSHIDDPVRVIAGIDWLPLNGSLDALLAGVPRGLMAVPLAGAYTPESGVNWAHGWRELIARRYPYYPSGLVTAARSTWVGLFGGALDFREFCRLVDGMPLEPMFNGIPGRWGLDEAMFSYCIHTRGAARFHFDRGFFGQQKRLDFRAAFDPAAVRRGDFTSATAVRGFPRQDPWVASLVSAIARWH